MEERLPKRKPLRLKRFDYNAYGSYFITICTENKSRILSNVVETDDGVFENELTWVGKTVESLVQSVPRKFGLEIDGYVIMPNHIHIIAVVTEKTQTIGARTALSKAVGYIKMQTTKAVRKRFEDAEVWQRGYHDHIIRNKYDYEKIKDYIYYNPMRWKSDCFYKD